MLGTLRLILSITPGASQALEDSESRERMLAFACWIADEMGVDENEYRQVGIQQFIGYTSLNENEPTTICCMQLDDFAHALNECHRFIAVCTCTNLAEYYWWRANNCCCVPVLVNGFMP